MLKKYYLSASLAIMMLAAAPAASYGQDATEPATTEMTAQLPDGQINVESGAVPSEEVNTVEESAIARKMTQAEKAQNVMENDSWGGAITIIAMVIVLGALIVLSIFFNIFGKISASLLSKKKLEAHGKTRDEVDEDHEDVDSGETIAAIAMALSEHFNGEHDMEDTILTIRRMRRAYSPWNSKIYNIRQIPEISKNPARPIPANSK